MTKVITLDGKLINVGEWDYQICEVERTNNPYDGEGDPPESWDYKISRELVVKNPMPEGALIEDLEVVESAKGRMLLASDWHELREDAYPPIKDQLDAAWKGGDYAEEMRRKVLAVKEKYPKPENQNPA